MEFCFVQNKISFKKSATKCVDELEIFIQWPYIFGTCILNQHLNFFEVSYQPKQMITPFNLSFFLFIMISDNIIVVNKESIFKVHMNK